MILSLFHESRETTLENVRIRLCIGKDIRRTGDALFSKARDIAIELDRLGMIKGGPYPKDRRYYERTKNNPLCLTEEGARVLTLFNQSRSAAYDEVFRKLYATHRYLRQFARHISAQELAIPTITSSERDLSPRYARHATLAEDVAHEKFDFEAFLGRLGSRLRRQLTESETTRVNAGMKRLIEEAKISATAEEPTEFTRKFLLRVNDVILPILFEEIGLGFDYRTHRVLWDLGKEFRLWWATPWHPEYEAWLVFRTATLQLSTVSESDIEFRFDFGLENTRKDFLSKLSLAYQEAHRLQRGTYVPAWELRAVFCRMNHCQGSVFNKLFEEHFSGSESYEIHTEIRRQWPQNEEPLRAGQRNIGTIRVVRK